MIKMKKDNKKKKRESFGSILLLGVTIGMIGGFILGMIIQQMIFGAGIIHIAEAFNGDINFNFNETKFVEQSKEIFIPAITYILNNSIIRDFSKCEPIHCECWDDGCNLYCMKCELNEQK